jgi:NodT family efflux transporter outer membrane factor (OMF) lipoprotein
MRLLFGSSLIAVAIVSGCSVGPDFTPPKADTPANWEDHSQKGAPSSTVSATPDTAIWWASFNDPELTSLIERARDSNPDLQQAALRIEEARAQLEAVGARNLPAVNLDSSYARTRLSDKGALDLFGGAGQTQTAAQGALNGIPASVVPFSLPPFDLFQTGFDASWEIDLFGRVRRSVESAEAQAQAVEESRHDALVSVYAEVARSYMQLRGVQRLIAITNDNLRAQQDSYKLTKAQAAGGETSNLDVESAAAEVATTEAQLPTLADQLNRAINALSYLLDLEPGALEKELGQPKPLPPNPPKVPIGMPSELAHRRPDIRAAEANLHAATANIGVATADLYPRLSMTASFGLQALKFSNLGNWASKFYSIGPALSIPVFNGVTYANITVQDVRQKEAALNYKTTVLQALHDVENAVSSYETEQVRLQSLQRAATANANSLSLAQQRYRAGLSSFLEVLDSERRLYASQTEVVRSNVTISTNLIAVYKSIGGGWDVPAPAPDPAVQPVATK